MQKALLVVDLQVDFCKGGALAAHDTESLLETVNALIEDYVKQGKLAICGIATEYCVRASFEDAVRNNFHVAVRRSAIQPVSPGSPGEQEAFEIFQS